MNGIVLDTCAAIWFADRAPMMQEAIDAIDEASVKSTVWLSPTIAWEVGLLVRGGRQSSLRVTENAAAWYARLTALDGFAEAPITGEITLTSAGLPTFHNDPADRFLIATSMVYDAALVTRDTLIAKYADARLIRLIEC